MSDEYEQVARGKLKLKTDSSKISKKKKKDKKNREKLERELEKEKQNNASQAPARQMTKAELSFKKMQEKMVNIFEYCGILYIFQMRNLILTKSNHFNFSKRNELWRKHL